MADNLMTKAWELDFAAHRWDADGSGANDPDKLARFTSSNVKFIALAIARASLRNGACWASQKTLGETTGVSKQTVGRAIAELESAGWLKRIGRMREDGGKSTDKLWLTLPELVLSAETVPPRPHRFFSATTDIVDHDETPGTQMRGEAAAPASAPPIKESGQEGELEGERKKASSPAGADAQATEDLHKAVELIWAKASKIGRQRSSKEDIASGLRAALGRGHAMETVLRGLGAYFASEDATKDDGAFQRGPHVMLAKDRFLGFLDEPPARPPADAPTAGVGSSEEPGPLLQRTWMKLFQQGMAWTPDRGPQPGRHGCRVADEIQREFGVEPYRPPNGGPEDAGAFD